MPKARRVNKTKSALCREWGLPAAQHLRYTGLAGIYWVYLSRQVRKEDFEKYGGKCVSCKTILNDWREGDCGHFVASGDGGFATRFLRQNLALQCKRCNNPSWRPDAPAFYALEVDRRWGAGTAEYLLSLKGLKQKELKPDQYEELIRALPTYHETILRQVSEKEATTPSVG